MSIELFGVLNNCENAFCMAWVKYVDIVREIFSTADETGYDNNQLWIKTFYTSRISKIELFVLKTVSRKRARARY